ncbi:MAG: PQQ-binding-like beta-propeller repeat protein, partial [Acidobacteriota bacterium]|nr:PQQ-binding-like beta-propeller repeat protein [Acidobacteriota bacterium]
MAIDRRRVVGLIMTVALVLCSVWMAESRSAATCPDLVDRWPYGPARTVAVTGDLVFFGSGPTLRIVDMTRPLSARVVGEITIEDVVSAVAVDGGFAYVANRWAGLRVIDVSEPSTPVEAGFLETRWPANSVAVSEDRVYLGEDASYYESEGFFRVIDVGTPSAPTVLGSLHMDSRVQGIAVDQDRVFVAGRGLTVLDVSRPSAIEVVGFATIGAVPNDVALSGGFAFVTTDWFGLQVWDVRVPSVPTMVGGVSMSLRGPTGVEVEGEFAYVTHSEEGLLVIDVGEPSNPVEVASRETPGEAVGLAVSDGRAYVADSSGGLRVIDAGFPWTLSEIAVIPAPGSAEAVSVWESHAYVASGDGGLRIVDLRGPAAPEEIGFLMTDSPIRDVAVQHDLAS